MLHVAPPKIWGNLESRVEISTDKLLSILEESGTKATFFILGSVARKHPELVRKISHLGHEVASHGYCHKLAYTQSPTQFRRDVLVTKSILEDLTSSEVKGYRAPSFSITRVFEWAYDTLIEAGYQYDSSLYPIRHPRYGNRSRRFYPFQLIRACGHIAVIPLSIYPARILERDFRFPISGGAYWRFLPELLITHCLASINRDGHPAICYLHPWELDTGQPVFTQLPLLTRFRHYHGIRGLEGKLRHIIRQFKFAPLALLIDDTLPVFDGF